MHLSNWTLVLASALLSTTTAKNASIALPALLDPVCTIFTVIESAVTICSCFTSNTILSVEGCTTTIEVVAPMCLTTTLTASSTVTSSLSPASSGLQSGSASVTTPLGNATTSTGPLTSSSTPPPVTGSGTSTSAPPPGSSSSSSSPAPPPPGSSSSSSAAPPPPASTSTSMSTPTTTAPPPVETTYISTDGYCGVSNGATCQGSMYGNCCGETGVCGHAAGSCGIGCQPAYGYCTNISNDGSCGNGVTCEGSVFGNCCSEFYFCGNGWSFCGDGCRPEYGVCGCQGTCGK